MYHYINDDVKIDFKLSQDLQYMMDMCEQDDMEDNYPLYNAHTEYFIYTLCKEACFQGDLTKKQWELLERRYPL